MTTAVRTALPSLRAPEDDNVAHLVRVKVAPHKPICGAAVQSSHAGHSWDKSGDTCSCGTPICPTCLAIRNTWKQTGAWEGP